jgi:hypothetical protein
VKFAHLTIFCLITLTFADANGAEKARELSTVPVGSVLTIFKDVLVPSTKRHATVVAPFSPSGSANCDLTLPATKEKIDRIFPAGSYRLTNIAGGTFRSAGHYYVGLAIKGVLDIQVGYGAYASEDFIGLICYANHPSDLTTDVALAAGMRIDISPAKRVQIPQ